MGDEVFDFAQVFSEDYLYFYGPGLEEASERDAELIWRLLQLEPEAEVLDLACGHGRIANRLARRSAKVTGLDASRPFLERANEDAAKAGVAVRYLHGDMRSLPFAEASFDCVLSWFTSFGYFGDEENRAVLREVRRVLRPGGRLLIENNNIAELLPRWLPFVVTERDGDLALDRHRFDPTTGRATTERTTVRDGQVRRYSFSVRMFMAVELRDWLHEAGFRTVIFRSLDGEPLDATSRRMITVAGR